jgi:hypothetical protein
MINPLVRSAVTAQPDVADGEYLRREIDIRMLSPVARGLPRLAAQYRDVLFVFGLALGIRLVVSVLMANTFDEDEFVYLALGRDVAHGSVPYRDFAFFHPPGILVLLGFLNPLTAGWWPLVRLIDVVIDSITTALVWRVGSHLYGRRAALAAGILYAVNPVVLISAVRVDQEPIITALGMVGLTLLLTKRTPATAVLAGACLGAACWIKYPMLVFLPVYLLAAPRRARMCLFGFVAAMVLLFLPYLGYFHQLVDDTIGWQLFHRQHTLLDVRLATTIFFWLVINPFAVGALLRRRQPWWLALGFATGAVFIFTSSTYSHYFVPIAPYAALLGAPLAARLTGVSLRSVVLGCVGITVAWALIIGVLPTKQYLVTSLFSDIHPIIQLIDRSTAPGTPILTNRSQFAYLAHRPWIAHYFWDDHDVVSAQYLERRLPGRSIVVLDPSSDSLSYPTGFTVYLDAHDKRLQINGTTVWLTSRP